MENFRKLTRDPSSKINTSLKKLSEADLDVFEITLDREMKIPNEYRDFLLETNGGSFLECVLPESPIGPLVVVQFLSLSEEAEYSIPRSHRNLSAFLPNGTLPFGEDPAGNSFAIGILSKNSGQVFFWDHETRKVYQLSGSFRDFIDRLVEDNYTHINND